jgi:hypothetical protein
MGRTLPSAQMRALLLKADGVEPNFLPRLFRILSSPNQPQILQNLAKPGHARAKPIKEKRLGFPWILLAEMSLFNGLS